MYSVAKASRAFLPAWSPRTWSAIPFASEPATVCASFRAEVPRPKASSRSPRGAQQGRGTLYKGSPGPTVHCSLRTTFGTLSMGVPCRRSYSRASASLSSSILGFGSSPPRRVRVMYRVRWMKASSSSASARSWCSSSS